MLFLNWAYCLDRKCNMTTAAELPPFNEIYNKIRSAGISSALIKRAILPSWWKNEDRECAAACQSAYLEIAAKLGISYGELINIALPLNLNASLQRVAFKTGNKNKNISELTASAHMGVRLAQIIATAYAESEWFVPFKPFNVEKCRQAILTGASWVAFSSLLNFCWSSGIPVVYWNGEAGEKFDGISTCIDDIPVIILGSAKNTAWTTFHLAHELGHIMLGHLVDTPLNFDSKIEEDCTGNSALEIAATEFGKKLLQGEQNLSAVKMSISPEELKRLAVTWRVSPATILLRSCWISKKEGDFKRLNARLSRMKSVVPTKQKVNELLQTKIGHEFDSILADWQRDFLDSLLG